MTGGMKRDADRAQFDGFAVGNRLRAAGEIVAVTQSHDVEGFLRCEHRAVAGTGMIGMAMVISARSTGRTGSI